MTQVWSFVNCESLCHRLAGEAAHSSRRHTSSGLADYVRLRNSRRRRRGHAGYRLCRLRSWAHAS
jgi:hypothetical protein